MKLHRMWMLSLVVVMMLSGLALSQNVNQQVGSNGAVDWSNQILRATGIGSPNPNMPETAQRAGAIDTAKKAALRNLLETVKGMTLDAETTVRNFMVENDVINTRVSGLVRNFTVVDTKYMSTGDIEVTVEMPMAGALADALLPQAMGGMTLGPVSGAVCPCCGQPWPAGKPMPAGMNANQPVAATTGGAFTGLVIDAKGLGVRPAMAPKVLDESGQEIYGSKYVSRDYAIQIGMVGYEKDVNRARGNDRVAGNPLIVKGLKSSGPNKADVVVSAATATAIRNAAASQNFLDKCKVMFIVD
jgi:hypothetical protein